MFMLRRTGLVLEITWDPLPGPRSFSHGLLCLQRHNSVPSPVEVVALFDVL